MNRHCERYWLLTWTTYATWMPGDERGFVSNVWNGDGPEVRHNAVGMPHDRDMPALKQAAVKSLRGEPVYLVRDQATVLVTQFQETANHRGWNLFATAIMRNHVHAFVGVPGDPEPGILLRDFKSYGSRALNKTWSKPKNDTWWTEGGSTRKKGEHQIVETILYVRDQAYPLEVWLSPLAIDLLGERGRSLP